MNNKRIFFTVALLDMLMLLILAAFGYLAYCVNLTLPLAILGVAGCLLVFSVGTFFVLRYVYAYLDESPANTDLEDLIDQFVKEMEEEEAQKLAAQADEPADEPVSPRRRVLVVEDNTVNRRLLYKILCDDYEVLDAKNGREALDILSANKGDISAVLLDLFMPVMDGYGVLESMRADAGLAAIPVIVTTASTDEDSEVKALELGATDFILKPYKPAVIKRRLNNVLGMEKNIRGEL